VAIDKRDDGEMMERYKRNQNLNGLKFEEFEDLREFDFYL